MVENENISDFTIFIASIFVFLLIFAPIFAPIFFANLVISIALIISIIGACFAKISAESSKESSQTASQALTASVVDSIMRDYAKQKMYKAMRKLKKFKTHFSDDNEGREKMKIAFHELENTNEKEFHNLNNYRRMVSHHFQRIYYLRVTNAIKDDKLMKNLSSKYQTEFYLKIIEPLEAGINPKYEKNSFNYYRKLYPELEKDYPEIKESNL
jgi:hypothetical protein